MVDRLTEEQELAVLKFYKNNLGELSQSKMAEKFNREDRGFEISVYQIIRLAREWKASGGYEDWLFERWFYLHKRVEETNVELAYKRVSSLMEKLITRKYSHKVDGKVQLEANEKFVALVRDIYAEKRVEPTEPPT